MVSKKYRKVLGKTKKGSLWDVGKGSQGKGPYDKRIEGLSREDFTYHPGLRREVFGESFSYCED